MIQTGEALEWGNCDLLDLGIGVVGPQYLLSPWRGDQELGDSARFFASERHALAYLRGVNEARYKEIVEEPLDNSYRELLEVLRRAGRLDEMKVLVDLGPGDARRSMWVAEELAARSCGFLYVPVDINETFLSIAGDCAQARDVLCKPLQTTFEALWPSVNALRALSPKILFAFGTTFLNMATKEFTALGRALFQKGDGILLSNLEPLSEGGLTRAEVEVYDAEEHEALSREALAATLGVPVEETWDWRYELRSGHHEVDLGFERCVSDRSLLGASVERRSVLFSYRRSVDRLICSLGWPSGGIERVRGERGATAIFLEWGTT